MAVIKTTIPRDWYKQKPNKTLEGPKKILSIDALKVKAKDDLPELITTKEAAALLKRHVKTIEQWRKEGKIQFFKVMGRYFTTPSLLAEFIETEFKKHG